MGIYLPNMEMPKNCKDCQLLAWNGGYYCMANRTGIEVLRIKSRRDDCPLIELPTHGRLGDLDALYAEISNGNKAYNGIEGYDGEYPNIANVDDCLEAIKYAETVIEAEGET